MKEDLEIARANTMALMQENAILKAQRNHKQNLKAKQQVIQILFSFTRYTLSLKYNNFYFIYSLQDNGITPEEKRRSDILDGLDINDVEELRNRLLSERKLRQDAERELHAQVRELLVLVVECFQIFLLHFQKIFSHLLVGRQK